MKSEALKNLVIINGKDIWTEYGVFLVEEKRGGRENLAAIMAPAKTKSHVGVTFREENGTKYSAELDVKSEERDVTLHFALVNDSRSGWLAKYRDFINFLKNGSKGWLSIRFPELDLTLRMFYLESTNYKPLTCLWKDGTHVSSFKVKFKEPEPTF